MTTQHDIAIAILLNIFFGFLIFIILYRNIDKLYDFHYMLRKDHPAIFKLFGLNDKYLDDKNKWIEIMRTQIKLLFLAIVAIALLGIVGILSY